MRRSDLLPEHSWLTAAESGQAPGPGSATLSPTQAVRPFGPDALSGTVTTAAAAAAPRQGGRDAASNLAGSACLAEEAAQGTGCAALGWPQVRMRVCV